MAFFDVAVEDGVAVIYFDQEESPFNTLAIAAMREFAGILDTLEHDDSAGSAVIISRKKDSFIVGADIKEFLTFETPDEVKAMIAEGHALLARLEAFPKPIVAAIQARYTAEICF